MNSQQPIVNLGRPVSDSPPAIALAGTMPNSANSSKRQEAAASANPGDVNDRMVGARLGIYSSLFHALKAKHPPTASHSLRVALGCSKWAAWRNMPEPAQGTLEVAALLHDLGKIGVPDELLQKAERLDGDERAQMDANRLLADQMLRSSGASSELIQIVQAARVSFQEACEQGITHDSASMLMIVDAFDSMTSEQVFRRALSRDKALEELCAFAGTQFQADLVEDFAVLISMPRPELELQLAHRWLSSLSGDLIPNILGGHTQSVAPAQAIAPETSIEKVFHYRLLDFVQDAIVYVDPKGQVVNWNRGAEELSGCLAKTVLHHRWTTRMMGLQNADGSEIDPENCPLKRLAETNTSQLGQYRLVSQKGREHFVELRAIPVFSKSRKLCGNILLFRDASQTVNLENRIRNLHEMATLDPLTKVANRAELDRQLPLFLESHLKEGTSGCCIICDIDFFKKINDTYGHQAGDDALVTFAGMLKDSARERDVVSRYGGEEFVLLCPTCEGSAGESRAEEIRNLVASTPVPALEGRNMTCSFGVTEIQNGDTINTLLARADRALMMAKENGRNRVVRLGTEIRNSTGKPSVIHSSSTATPQARGGWLSWFYASSESVVIASKQYLAAVPKEVAIQKLEGFIADHRAELKKAGPDKVVLKIEPSPLTNGANSRPTAMIMEIEFSKVNLRSSVAQQTLYQSRTCFDVKISPFRARDRRVESLEAQAHQILLSFESYLVAQEIDEELEKLIIRPR